MDLDGKTLQKIQYLLSKSLDNDITPEEAEFLDQMIISSPQARRHYVEFIQVHANLHRIHEEQTAWQSNKDNYALDTQLWETLLSHEKTADYVEMEMPDDNEPEVVVPVKVRKVSKLQLLVAITSVAAMFLFIAYIHFNPRIIREEVAEIADSINAEWAEESLSAMNGNRLLNNSGSLHLRKGLAKIRFDYGAEVVVEGPAQINLNSPGQMLLSYGRISVDVPEAATGFTVETPNSSIVDLGTEFGVKVESDGSTEIHMFKGKASLVPGKKGKTSKGQLITAGKAVRVKASGLLSDITFDAMAFIKKISSKSNTVWRGKNIDLADIVGGGDGFGTAEENFGLNPLTGENVEVWSGVSVLEEEQSMSGPFMQAQSKWIDAVFIPDGDDGPVQIAKNGLSFDDFGDTSGRIWVYLLNRKRSFELGTDDNPNMAGKPCLIMHANLGITFDLERIRERFDGQVTLKAFRSQSGFKTPGFDNNKVDFWVLVDGQVRYQKLGAVATVELEDVEISLSPDDRYLTLATTESDDGMGGDWAMFVSPTLILE